MQAPLISARLLFSTPSFMSFGNVLYYDDTQSSSVTFIPTTNQISVPDSWPIGTSLLKTELVKASNGTTIHSNGEPRTYIRISIIGPQPDQLSYVYQSSINGIGFRFLRQTLTNPVIPVIAGPYTSPGTGAESSVNILEAIEFIKTGPVSTGQILSGLFAQWRAGANLLLLHSYYLATAITFSPIHDQRKGGISFKEQNID